MAMPDECGYAICSSTIARRSVKYLLCLLVKLCVVFFIRSATIMDGVASNDFGQPTIPMKP